MIFTSFKIDFEVGSFEYRIIVSKTKSNKQKESLVEVFVTVTVCSSIKVLHNYSFLWLPVLIWFPTYLQSSGDSGANVKRLEEETEAKIDELKKQSSNISPDIVQMLLKYVTTVKNWESSFV